MNDRDTARLLADRPGQRFAARVPVRSTLALVAALIAGALAAGMLGLFDPYATEHGSWTLVVGLASMGLLGLGLQIGRAAPTDARQSALERLVPLGEALCFVATSGLAAVALAFAGFADDTATFAYAASALGVALSAVSARAMLTRVRALGPEPAAARRSARIRETARAVHAALSSERESATVWERRAGGGTDEHLVARNAEARVQVYDGLVQIWHRKHRLDPSSEERALAVVGAGVSLELERPDRYVLAAPDTSRLGAAAGRVADLLLQSRRLSVVEEHAPLEGLVPPADLERPLVMATNAGTWTLERTTLTVAEAGEVVSFELAQPFALDLLTTDGAIVFELRQRSDEAGEWRRAALAAEGASRALDGLAVHTGAALKPVNPLVFESLWRRLYWAARLDGQAPPSIPGDALARRGAEAHKVAGRKVRARGPRVPVLGAGLVALAATALAYATDNLALWPSFPVADGSSETVWFTAALVAASALAGVLALFVTRPRSVVEYTVGAVASMRTAAEAILPELALGEADLRIAKRGSSKLSPWLRGGARIDAEVATGTPWLRVHAAIWPGGSTTVVEQLELHVATESEDGQTLARHLATVQMQLAACGVPALLMRTDESVTLAVQQRRRATGDRAHWDAVARALDGETSPRGAAARPFWPTPPTERSVAPTRAQQLRPWGLAGVGAAFGAAFVLGVPHVELASYTVAETPNGKIAAACPQVDPERPISSYEAAACVLAAGGVRGHVVDAAERLAARVPAVVASGDVVCPDEEGSAAGEARSWHGYARLSHAATGARISKLFATTGLGEIAKPGNPDWSSENVLAASVQICESRMAARNFEVDADTSARDFVARDGTRFRALDNAGKHFALEVGRPSLSTGGTLDLDYASETEDRLCTSTSGLETARCLCANHGAELPDETFASAWVATRGGEVWTSRGDELLLCDADGCSNESGSADLVCTRTFPNSTDALAVIPRRARTVAAVEGAPAPPVEETQPVEAAQPSAADATDAAPPMRVIGTITLATPLERRPNTRTRQHEVVIRGVGDVYGVRPGMVGKLRGLGQSVKVTSCEARKCSAVLEAERLQLRDYDKVEFLVPRIR